MKRTEKPVSESNPLAFLQGGGEMADLIRSMDWSKTSLGPVVEWPQSLRTTVSICLASDLPICVIWGPGLVQLYNDAYRVICGDKHPRSMGQNFPECWKEAWPVIGEAHDSALAGNTAFLESQQIFLERHGYVEECFFTFSFSPIRDEAGGVGGLFHPVIEMTARMLSERRMRTLRDLTAQTSKAKSVDEVFSLSAQVLVEYNFDLPFAQFYTLEPDGDQARLAGSTDPEMDSVVSLCTAGSGVTEQASWPFEEVLRSGSAVHIDGLRMRIGATSFGPYPEPASKALALPLIPPGASRPSAVFIVGVSSRLRINEAYLSFYDLLAFTVSTAVANARAYDDERRRAKALAELDRAKIAFFSNVSHEFRTPLTLMLGPAEEALAASDEHLTALQRERLEIIRRNGLRLQRLVNSLLDFSRIEAGRVRAVYEATALADFTADLASNFRSACERAGLALHVDCPPLSETVFVDHAMWETVVLNLLSNAFKFTFAGEIVVSLRQSGSIVELRVCDTGTGVPEEEVSLMFERFHRVPNARGRSYEGSGIGLALVQELVRLHGGFISVESKLGTGTTFTVSIPLGSQHLPQDQVGCGPTDSQLTSRVNAFVEEALLWLPDAGRSPVVDADLLSFQDEPTGFPVSTQRPDDDRPLVLVADDNADMRQYLVRMLGTHYRTEAVPDGEAALAAIRGHAPDLILTDVMMPGLDGFGLLKALRDDPHTKDVPVIMLSARAGEESRIEGMQEGADDYLVKPFSGRELLARVAAHLQMARMRRESFAAIQASEAQFRALVCASSDVVYRMNADWTEMRQLQGREFIADTHEPSPSWLQKYIHPADQTRVVKSIHEAIRSKGVFELEHQVLRIDGLPGWTFSRAIPLMDSDGTVIEWFGMASDVTARKEAQAALIESEQKYRTLFNSMDEGYCVIEMIFDAANNPVDYLFLEVNPAFEKHTGLRDAQGKRMREIAPDHDDHWFETYGRVAVTGKPTRFINEAKALEGRWFDAYAFRLGGDGSHRVALLLNDISDRRVSEVALRASEARLRLALDAAELGTWHVEPATRAVTTDARFRAIFGTTEDWTDYFQVFAVIHPDDLSFVQEAEAAATRLEDPIPYAIEYRIVHPDGSLRWVSAKGRSSIRGVGPTRTVISFDGTVADITNRKQGEQDRERLVARLREEEKRKDEFLATLAHELRNPLAPIRNGLQILSLGQGDAAATEQVRLMMERQLEQMVHLIDDLLDLSRISQGKIELRKERIELAKAIQEAIDTSRPSIAQADHELMIKFPPDPIYVDADLTRLVQVFSNLLNNAAKFMDRGGRIRVTMQQNGSEAVVSIEDDGIGIPTEMLSHIFEMFTQVDGNLERSKGGLGIGLSIVKRLIELHGGSLEARSGGLGRGSEFIMRLPLALSTISDEPTNQHGSTLSTVRQRILVVDDNLDAAESFVMLLTMMGHETMTANDGPAALDIAATFKPDVIFLDIGMPKMNGYEVARRIRQQPWSKDTVLIALTGWGKDEDKRRSLEAGLDFHLIKPVHPTTLEKLLADVTAARP